MEQIGLEVLLIFILLVINGLFSMSEIAVVSSRKVRLQKRADEGNQGARAAIEIIESPNHFLSTVQIGITLVGVLSGAFGGAALAVHIKPFIEKISFLAPYSQSISFALVVLVITYFSLVIGELVPKRIALNTPESIAAFVSRPMNLITKSTAPVVWLLSNSTQLILKIFRQKDSEKALITEEEIRAVIIQGQTSGVLDDTEQELMESVISLDDQRISVLMTPRLKIGWIDSGASEETIRQKLAEYPFSRLLIANGNLDEISGFVKSKDILNQVMGNNQLDLKAVTKKPLFIPETATALNVLERFRDSGTHLAVIVDEFGATQGIITTNDILEAIVGEMSVNETRSQNVVLRDDGSWLLNARLANAEFCKILEIQKLPESETGKYHTLAGFIIKRLEKVPSIGDKVVWGDWLFEVVDMDGKRVDQVLVSKIGQRL